MKLKSVKDCGQCTTAFQSEENYTALADMTNVKSYGFLKHPSKPLYTILIHIENYFSSHVKMSDNIYEDCVEYAKTLKLSFPCAYHGQYIIAYLIHFFVVTRMKQYYSVEKKSNTKKSQSLKKQAKLRST